jgi:hypothetical protein
MKFCGECGAPLKAVGLTGPRAPSYPRPQAPSRPGSSRRPAASGSRANGGLFHAHVHDKGTYTSRDIDMTYWLERAEAEMREPL